MVNRNLIHSLEDDAIELEMGELFSTTAQEDLEELNLTELYYPDGVGAEQLSRFAVAQLRTGRNHSVQTGASGPLLRSRS